MKNRPSLIHLLNRPYPGLEYRMPISIVISLFIATFLIVFQPFGLSTYTKPNKILLTLGYGLITFIVLMLDLYLLPYFFKRIFRLEKWTVIKQIIFLLFIVLSIGISNTLYSSYVFGLGLTLSSLMLFQLYTVVVGIIPITIITIWNQNMLLKRNLSLAQDLNQQLNSGDHSENVKPLIKINSSNNKDDIEINLDELLYIESIGNYINVYLTKDNTLSKVTLRNTISNVENKLSDKPSIMKSHRGFLINLSMVEEVRGNAQGLRLKIRNASAEIPVSRNYTSQFRQKLSEFSS